YRFAVVLLFRFISQAKKDAAVAIEILKIQVLCQTEMMPLFRPLVGEVGSSAVSKTARHQSPYRKRAVAQNAGPCTKPRQKRLHKVEQFCRNSAERHNQSAQNRETDFASVQHGHGHAGAG